MTTKELTCIVCPMGCPLSVTLDDEGKFVSVTGHTCKRGAVYAENETTHPTRTLTTTMKVGNREGKVLPVKSDCAFSKEKMFEAMEIVNSAVVTAPVKIGDVIIADVCGECNIVATANLD